MNLVFARWIPAKISATNVKSARKTSSAATLASVLSAPSLDAHAIAATKNVVLPIAMDVRLAPRAVNHASAQ